jgi:hypothetical protein
MRKSFSLALVIAIVALGIPSAAFAAHTANRVRLQNNPQQFATINGTARSAKGDGLPDYKVRVRDSSTGAVVAEGTSNASGGFSITGLAPGSYIVEIVNGAGQVVGMSAITAVGAGSIATVAVTATALGTVGAASSGGGFSLFGLGTAASYTVIVLATGAGIAGIVVATHNASPSR